MLSNIMLASLTVWEFNQNISGQDFLSQMKLRGFVAEKFKLFCVRTNWGGGGVRQRWTCSLKRSWMNTVRIRKQQLHLLSLSGQVEAVPLAQFDQPLHVPLGLCREAVSINLLLQTKTEWRHENSKTIKRNLKNRQCETEKMRDNRAELLSAATRVSSLISHRNIKQFTSSIISPKVTTEFWTCFVTFIKDFGFLINRCLFNTTSWNHETFTPNMESSLCFLYSTNKSFTADSD